MNEHRSYEDRIKAKIMDYLLSSLGKNIIIASEAPFSDQRRRVDLLVIGESLLGIEIKGDRDNLHRFTDQLADYNKYFEQVIVFTSTKHLSSVERIAPSSVGIVTFCNSSWDFVTAKNGKLNSRITKESWIQFLISDDLRSILRDRGYRGSLRQPTISLRKRLLSKLTKEELRTSVIKYLRARYRNRFSMFMSERGDITHEEDVPLLRLHEKSRIIL